jgi:hypothetical protein
VLGEAAEPVLWRPAPGRHHLSVIAEDGRVLDSLTFLVRGRDVAEVSAGTP